MNDASSTLNQPPPDHEPNLPHTDDVLESIQLIDGNTIQERKRIQRDQKANMLDHLIRNIDIMIYAQLSVLYYMDCSLTNFVLRGGPHWFYFSPKPSIFPPPPLNHRPYIGIIFGINLLCLLLHLVRALPAAGEATRGYVHGGLLIDFVGQKSPVGRWKLMVLDLLVLGLQILVLGVTLERRTLDADNRGEAHVGVLAEEATQDHDSEERGMLRQDSSVVEDIEMQDLPDASAGEPDGSLENYNRKASEDQHPLDPYYTGEHIIANLRLLDTIRTRWQATGVSADGSNASGVQAAVVAAAAGRTLTFRLNEEIERSD